jgi:hypothetical protein
LRALWPFLVLVVPGPVLLAILDRSFVRFRIDLLALQVLLLTAVLLYPFGLKLVSAAAPGTGALWNGYFLSAWSGLPVPRTTVLRAVYAHGWVAGGLVWLLVCLYTVLNRGGPWLPLFELPGVVLAAAVVLCAAVGDRWRGSLALVSLVLFQLGVPMGLAAADSTLSLHLPKGAILMGAAYLLALVGGVPSLVHLRRA